MTKIGSNIKKIRQTKGLSQQAFADLFSISRGNISSYEENRAEPKVETIIKIANFFSITLEHLLTKELSINEILQYDADKLLDDEQRMAHFKLKEVTFINEDILAKVWHKEEAFTNFEAFPQLLLPVTSFGKMVGVSFNVNIPHHLEFQRFKPFDVLIFQEIHADNMHLAVDRLGMFLVNNRLKLGKFESINKELHLFINDEIGVAVEDVADFWMLTGYYNGNLYA